MIEKQRKPFHLKNKFLYQTKINIWNKNENHLQTKLVSKKWSFLKKKYNKKSKKNINVLSTFKFSPFSYTYNKRFLKKNFKNNVYFRKQVRLKFGRLKNKDLYNLFKKKKNYKGFIDKLSSRLDVILYKTLKILDKTSIFSIRQSILHGNFLLNGRVVKSPNIRLQAFDIISFRLTNLNLIINDKDSLKRGNLVDVISSILKDCCDISSFKEEERKLFFDKLSIALSENYIYPKHKDDMNTFINLIFDDMYSNNEIKTSKKNVSKISYCNIIRIAQLFKEIEKQKLVKYNTEIFKAYFIMGLGLLSTPKVNNLGFFNDSFCFNNFEIMLSNKDNIDIVFLGNSSEDQKIDSNDKYSLHYLY